MSEQQDSASIDSEKAFDRVEIFYSAYRQNGWALSATVIAFATALLAWGLPPTPRVASGASVLQIVLGLATIAAAFAQQFFYYEGGLNRARSLFETGRRARKRWRG